MRSTSNPAFRNLPTGGGYGSYAGFGQQQAGPAGFGGYQAPPTTNERPMTVDDVVTKTAATLGVALVTGIITAVMVLGGSLSPYPPMIIGGLVGFVLSLVIIFKRLPNPALVLSYSAAEGIFLGAITGVFESFVPGIAFQAILGTGLVFATMLILYKTGTVKVTPRLTKWIIGATAAAVRSDADQPGAVGLFGVNTGLRDAGALGIGFSLLIIGIAAFNFLLDFDMADQMIRTGTPAKFAWYAAFGLMTTLVWLYLEMLRLLYYLNSD